MKYSKFELTLISAKNLADVRRLFKMKVYARVSIGNNPETEWCTPTDIYNESNPAWNCTVKYSMANAVEHYGEMLVIKLYCERTLGDKYVGEVDAPMKDLFDNLHAYGGNVVVRYPVKRGSSYSQGVLKFSYKFGE